MLYRSGWGDKRSGLYRLLLKYREAGGQEFSIQQLLVEILGIKFESIAHHGQKLINGVGDMGLVRSQASKINIVYSLLEKETSNQKLTSNGGTSKGNII